MQHFSNSHRNAFRGVPVGLFWLAFLTIPLISVSSCWKVRLCSFLVLSQPLYKADVRAMSSQEWEAAVWKGTNHCCEPPAFLNIYNDPKQDNLKGDQPLWTTCLYFYAPKYFQWPQKWDNLKGDRTTGLFSMHQDIYSDPPTHWDNLKGDQNHCELTICLSFYASNPHRP